MSICCPAESSAPRECAVFVRASNARVRGASRAVEPKAESWRSAMVVLVKEVGSEELWQLLQWQRAIVASVVVGAVLVGPRLLVITAGAMVRAPPRPRPSRTR